MQAVSLMRSGEMSIPKPKLPETLTNGPLANAPLVSATAAANVTATGAPQPPTLDITTMSDHDLLRYINPSCFDQGKYYSLKLKYRKLLFFIRKIL